MKRIFCFAVLAVVVGGFSADAAIVEDFAAPEGPISTHGWSEHYVTWGAVREWTVGRGSTPFVNEYGRGDRSTSYPGETVAVKSFAVAQGYFYSIGAFVRHQPDKMWAQAAPELCWFEIDWAHGTQTAEWMAYNPTSWIVRWTENGVQPGNTPVPMSWTYVGVETTETTSTTLTIGLKVGHQGSQLGVPQVDELDLSMVDSVYEWSLY